MEKVRLHACARYILKNLWDILFSVGNPVGLARPSQSVKFKKTVFFYVSIFHFSKHHHNSLDLIMIDI